MQTFKLDLRFQVTAIVPEQFLKDTLDAVNAPDATPFLKRLGDEFNASVSGLDILDGPSYDAACDTLVSAVLTNALRKGTQANTALFLSQAGIGSRVSPVELLSVDAVQPRSDSQGVTKAEPVRDVAPLSQAEAGAALDVDAGRAAHDIAYSHSAAAQG